MRRLIAEKPHGVIFLNEMLKTPGGREAQAALGKAGIACVAYGRGEEGGEYDSVGSDHAAGAHALTRWLIGQGRRRILRLWCGLAGSYPEWLRQRDAGYERAMRESGLEVLPAVTTPGGGVFPISPETFECNARLMAGYLLEYLSGAGKVDALMSPSDGEADAMTAGCRLLGRQPGKEVLVVGYDNYWAESPSRPFEPMPPAATVDKLNEKIGRELVAVLMARTAGELPAEPQRRLVRPELVVMAGRGDGGIGDGIGGGMGVSPRGMGFQPMSAA